MNVNFLTEQIISGAIAVHRELGPGLLESTYELCLAYEIAERGLHHDAQLLSYLKLSGCELGLLINFNVPLLKDGIRRMVRSSGTLSASSASSAVNPGP